MEASKLVAVYDRMKEIGIIGNKREFSRTWCGKGQTYLRDYIENDRLEATVPAVVIAQLRGQLVAVAACSPAGPRRSLLDLVDGIDRAAVTRH